MDNPAGLVGKYNITQVPTLVILKRDIEVGRIVKKASFSWEDNILEIFRGTGGKGEL